MQEWAAGLDFVDELLLHLGGVGVGFHERVHIYVAGSGAAVGIEVDFGFGAQDGYSEWSVGMLECWNVGMLE